MNTTTATGKTLSTTVPTSDEFRTFTRTACGLTITRDEATGIMGPLTPCCASAATGVAFTGREARVVCKWCREPVEERYGMGADSKATLGIMLEAFNCPVPDDCADHTDWTLDREAGLYS